MRDHFTYIILPMFSTGKYGQSINRSVVRKRISRDNNLFMVSDSMDPKKFRFETRDGRFLVKNTTLEKNINIPEIFAGSVISQSIVTFSDIEHVLTDFVFTPQDPVPVIILCSTIVSIIPKIYYINNILNNDITVQIYSLSDNESIITETDKPDSINDSVNKNNQTDNIYGVINHLWKKELLFLTVEINTGEHENILFALV